MRYIFICLLLTSCLCQAQSNDYDFIWDANSESDMKSYKFWVWEGNDTLTATFENYHGEFSHDSLVTIYGTDSLILVDTYSSLENGEYIIIATKAMDIDLNESDFSYSKAYKKDDKVSPMNMAGLEIRK